MDLNAVLTIDNLVSSDNVQAHLADEGDARREYGDRIYSYHRDAFERDHKVRRCHTQPQEAGPHKQHRLRSPVRVGEPPAHSPESAVFNEGPGYPPPAGLRPRRMPRRLPHGDAFVVG